MRKRDNFLPLDLLRPYLLDLAPRLLEAAGVLDWRNVFGNDHPVEMEVGFGKGAFLVASGQAHPETNYLGLEIDRGLLLYVANRLAKRQLTNVRLVQADAGELLIHCVPSRSLQAIHVYFPDPWWKRRHRKRRVFTPQFVAECVRCLRVGGRLAIASDVAEYFSVMQKLVATHGELEPITSDELARQGWAVSNFERKARSQGRVVENTTYVKSTPAARSRQGVTPPGYVPAATTPSVPP